MNDLRIAQIKRLISELQQIEGALLGIKEQIHRIYEQKEANGESGPNVPGAIAEAIRAAHEDVPAYEKCQRKKEYSQQNRLIFVTFLAFVAAAIYAWVSHRTLQDANRNFKLEQRPWVGISKLEITSDTLDFVEQANGKPRVRDEDIRFFASLQNYGHFPARHIMEAYKFAFAYIPTSKMWDGLCKNPRTPSSENFVIGKFDSLFPGKDAMLTKEGGASYHYASFQENPQYNPPRWLVGCITYEDPSLSSVFSTRFIYEVQTAGNSNPLPKPTGSDVPANSVAARS